MRRLWSLILLALSGGCAQPYYPPVVVPPPPIVVPPPQPRAAKWADMKALEAKASAPGATVTEAEAVASLGVPSKPDPYVASNGDRVVSWDVMNEAGTQALKMHAHFRGGVLTLPLVVE